MLFRPHLLSGALLLVSCRAAVGTADDIDPRETPDGGAPRGSSATRPSPPPPADTTQPSGRLVESRPTAGDRSFYPVQIFDQGQELGVGERATLRFSFDQPMNVSEATVEIVRGTSEFAAGRWSNDGRTLEVGLLGTEDRAPLEAEADYEVRLDRLRTRKNAAVTPAAIRFRTAARDTVIDHACFHTLVGPFGKVSAASMGMPVASAPSVSKSHRQWTVDIPYDAGTFRGQVQVAFSETGLQDYLLLLDRSVPVKFEDEGGGSVTANAVDAPAACPGIRRVVPVTLMRGKTYRMTLGPSAEGAVKLIWEALQ